MTPSLRRLYSVRSRSTTRDAAGQRSDAYEHKLYLWGEEPRDGSTSTERDAVGQSSEETVRLRARFSTQVAVGDQLVSGDVVLYVRSANDLDGTRRMLQVVASRSPAAVQ